MKKILIILFFLSGFVKSQNLVPNWSFETYTACPSSSSDLPKAAPWIAPTSNSTDYYNSCASSPYNVPYAGASFQYAKEGNAFAGVYFLNGLVSNYREYLQDTLLDTLLAGKCYYGEFYVNLHDKAKFACNNIAASFSKTKYATNGNGLTPLYLPEHIINFNNPIVKDTGNWVRISGLYTASGGESFITIGNFKDYSNTDTTLMSYGLSNIAYYHIDAVSVYSINPSGTLPWTYRDTTVAIGDSVYIGNTMGGTFTSNWYTYGGAFIDSGSGIYVKPVATSTYVVQFTVCGVPRSDTLKVSVTGVGINELKIKNEELRISPNPNNGVFEVEILNLELGIKDAELRIINVLGQEIKKEKLLSKKQQLDVFELSNGMYYLQLLSNAKTISVKKIIKE